MCPSCSSEANRYEYKGTHFLICSVCPVIQFEFIGSNDLKNLSEWLSKNP